MSVRFTSYDTLITPRLPKPSKWMNEIIGKEFSSNVDKTISDKPALADQEAFTALKIYLNGTNLSLLVEADGCFISMQQVLAELSLFMETPQECMEGRRPLEFYDRIIKEIFVNTNGWTLCLDH